MSLPVKILVNALLGRASSILDHSSKAPTPKATF